TQVTTPDISGIFTGFFANNISFVDGSQTVDLSPFSDVGSCTFLAKGNIDFKNPVDFSGMGGDLSIISAGTITTPVEGSLRYSGSSFLIEALKSVSFDSMFFENVGGSLSLVSGQNLMLHGCSVNAAGINLNGANVILNNCFLNPFGQGARPAHIAAVSSF